MIGVKTICLGQFSNGHLIMVVMNYARQNPDKLSQEKGLLVFYALSKYKC